MTKGVIVAGTGKKWLLGCGLGCGIPVLLVIILTVGGGIVMMKPYGKAVDAQKDLTAAYGERSDYSPLPDGITPARLEAFMAVRRSLMPLCDDFVEIGRSFQKMDNLDQGGEEPSKGEVVEAMGDVMGAVFGIAGNIGRFTQFRNEALLAEEMGLGEYIWIYTLVYTSWLGYLPGTDFDSDVGGEFSSSDQKIIRQLLRNHAVALAGAGRQDVASLWEAEAERLERRGGSGVPWEVDGLPASMTDIMEPYRGDLESVYCPATSSFEFSRVRKRGLTVTAD